MGKPNLQPEPVSQAAYDWQKDIRSAYLHIPFCVQKCAYCDFLSVASTPLIRQAYVETLIHEMRRQFVEDTERRPPLRTIYLGGGTPGILTPRQVESLLHTLEHLWGIEEGAECTLETNPGLQNTDSFRAFAAAGINRLSMGAQALQDSLLKRLGRIHSAHDWIRATEAAQQAGFERISCDLMYGLPGQTQAELAASVQAAVQLGYTHVSAYSLILEEGTELERRYSHPTSILPPLPGEEEERNQHATVRRLLNDAGLLAYEISNYCVPGEESKHNQVYWSGKPYWGFGAGAHSYVDAWRRGSLWPIPLYQKAVKELGLQQLYPLEERIDLRSAMLEFFLLGFRMLAGVCASDFRSRFHQEIPEILQKRLAALLDTGWIYMPSADCWALTNRGEDYANQVFGTFLDWESDGLQAPVLCDF